MNNPSRNGASSASGPFPGNRWTVISGKTTFRAYLYVRKTVPSAVGFPSRAVRWLIRAPGKSRPRIGYPDRTFKGHVESIQAGAGARFSLFPPENATGNYIKVVQRVPVKILLDDFPGSDLALGPGMSVVPKVHVK